jgi:YD repeat-containing protein
VGSRSGGRCRRGNKTSETDANNHTTTYVYDELNRLSKVTYPDTKTTLYTRMVRKLECLLSSRYCPPERSPRAVTRRSWRAWECAQGLFGRMVPRGIARAELLRVHRHSAAPRMVRKLKSRFSSGYYRFERSPRHSYRPVLEGSGVNTGVVRAE